MIGTAIPIRSEQLFACLNAQASITSANDRVAKWDLVLSGDFTHNLLQVIVLYFSRALPGDEMSELSVISIYSESD